MILLHNYFLIFSNILCNIYVLSNNIKLIGFVSELDRYEILGKTTLDRHYINNKVGTIDRSKYNILVAHNPLEYNSYIEYGSNLVLSGHVHGGLIRLPLIGALLSSVFLFTAKGINFKDTQTFSTICHFSSV